ncbi:MAG: RNase adapter RapZ [Candidatus Eremiobacteraeota bacterium]|nr:RNase adapter RapZ [Candidatus Eremiobacteraeota bacterium]
MNAKEFVLITGMSGAGKTIAIKSLEDLNFFWVDNLPPSLIPTFVQLCSTSGFNRVAVAADDGANSFLSELQVSLETVREYNFNTQIIFLDAPDEILVRRYSETYRKHPLASSGRLLDGIEKERKKLREIRGLADIVIDTGDLKRGDLKEEITRLFFQSEDGSPPIMITILSFGYKFGIPLDVDLVFDARVLPNPFYDPNLQCKDGTDESVRQFVFRGDDGRILLDNIYQLLEFIIPLYIRRGKSHLTIGVGCTGGRHRSVAVTTRLAQFLKEKNYQTFINHRDIKK